MSQYDTYESPLVARNATEPMIRLFSPRYRIGLWRQLWIELADAERKLGLPITQKQISQLRKAADTIDFESAARYEKKLRHDVMAHVHTFGDAAPAARGILHLGATSAFIVDNADLIIMREALRRVAVWLANVIDALGTFSKKHKKVVTLGYTHFQPAQLTTVGKRATLWCWDFVRDLEEVEARIAGLRFRGVKGTTGTQASFMELFNGNFAKVRQLDRAVAKRFGFDKIEPVTGQTYSRKVDAQVVSTLAQVAVSVHKFCNDLRLLANLKEAEEPFETSQIGSSAMAYKRNPMRSERATGLARFVISLSTSPLQTAAEQWFERTLDDSANKRLSVPEPFLATDGMLRIVSNIARGIVLYPKVIDAHVRAELPFMATERILMSAVAAGGDRQDLHERIRVHSQAAAAEVKDKGRPNDLLERLESDPAFEGIDIRGAVEPKDFIGAAPQQVDDFLAEHVQSIRRRYRKALGEAADLNV